MQNLLVIYESSDYRDYGSLASLRPVFCLRTGMTALWQRLKRWFPGYDLQLACRPEVAHVASRETGLVPNQFETKSCQRIVFLDAAIRPDEEFVSELLRLEHSRSFSVNHRIVAIVLVGEQIESAASLAKALASSGDNTTLESNLDSMRIASEKVEIKRHSHIWDLMLTNPANLCADYEIALNELGTLREHNLAERLEGSRIVGSDATYIHPTATVLPGVVFDTTAGPVYIDEGVVIEPGTYIVGPFYAAPDCKLLGGKLAGSSLGPLCQIAGELEESVLQGYVNKHHAGFIGHSYIGEWVNFGAMTTNSDLKNNYSSVRVAIGDDLLDSGSNKVGAFIGDHTKFGIGTLLNTGINIGVFCNIFGGTLISDKFVPPFSWGASGNWNKHVVDKALQTAERAMARRGRALADEDITLIRSLSV